MRKFNEVPTDHPADYVWHRVDLGWLGWPMRVWVDTTFVSRIRWLRYVDRKRHPQFLKWLYATPEFGNLDKLSNRLEVVRAETTYLIEEVRSECRSRIMKYDAQYYRRVKKRKKRL